MITTLAPCGMNCELCHSFQDNKKSVPDAETDRTVA